VQQGTESLRSCLNNLENLNDIAGFLCENTEKYKKELRKLINKVNFPQN